MTAGSMGLRSPVTFTDASASSTTVKLEAGDATIRATFRPTTHTLSISTVGTGTVTKNPNQATYDYNTSVTLTAVDGTGYHFDHWSGNLSGSANPTPITMDADKSVTAHFAINQYTLTVNTDGTTGAIVDPSGDETVDHGALTTIQVVTTPTGSVFDGWECVSGNLVTFTDASASSTTVKLEAGDATIRATFRPTTHTLSISTVGTGTVTKNPNQATYDYNTPVQLIPNPGANYHFDHWSVDLTGSANPGSIVMNGDKSVTATFLIDQYNLTVNTDGTPGVVIDPSGMVPVDHGAETPIQVLFMPEGTAFDQWEWVSGSAVTFDDKLASSTTVRLEAGPATIRATFKPTTHTLSISTVGTGTVTRDPVGPDYDYNTLVTLTPDPGTGYHFDHWAGDMTGSADPGGIVMNGDKDVTAHFAINQYNLTVNTDGTLGAILDPLGLVPVEHGALTPIQVIKVPDGHVFTGWQHVSGSPVTFTDPLAESTTVKLEVGDAVIQANFEITTHILTIDTVGLGTVTVDPDQAAYDWGTGVLLTAYPGTGFEFTGWTGDLVTTNNPRSITMDVDKDITANFTLKSYNLTVRTDGTQKAEVSPSGMFAVYHGALTTIEVTKIPKGNEFQGWEIISGTSVTIDDPLALITTVMLEDGDAIVQANFGPTLHTLTVDTVGAGNVIITPDQLLYEYGDMVTLTAIPETGYSFDGWSGDLVSTDNPETLEMDGEKSVTATFTLNSYNLTVTTDGTTDGTIDAEVSPSGTVPVYHGLPTDIAVTVIPEGYEFVKWTITDGDATIENDTLETTQVTLEDGDATVQANFALKTYTLTVVTDGLLGAEVFPVDPTEVTHGIPQVIAVTAIPEGYEFVNWTILDGDMTIENDTLEATNVTLETGDATVQANFALKTYTLTVVTDGLLGAEVFPVDPVEVTHGIPQLIAVTAIPEGYEFINWTIQEGDLIFEDDTLEATDVTLEDGDATVQANFALKTYTLTVVTDGLLGAAVFPVVPKEVTHGIPQLIAVTAIPEGYEFVNWTIMDGDMTIENDTLEVTNVILETGDATVQANFVLKTYTLTVVTDGLLGAAVFPVDPMEVTHGIPQLIAVTAIPEGYEFINWTIQEGDLTFEDDTLEATNVILENGDATVQANFALKTYRLTVVSDGTPGVSLFPDVPVEVTHGVPSFIFVQSVPESYGFVNWTLADGDAIIENDTLETTTVILENGSATIQGNFEKIIRVLNVSIPNNPLTIGNVITAIITVVNDLGQPLSLVSGDIGGYPLTNLVRLNPNTYFANITIVEGGNSYTAEEDIPVNNLVLTDGVIQNEPYELPIVQGNDPIDASLPVINYVRGEAGDYRIGDEVTLHINADTTGYSIDPVSVVNGISLSEPVFSFIEVGEGDYELEYRVSEGDQDVAAGELVASIVLVKPSGNKNNPFSTLTGIDSLTIDANPPVISSLEVPDGAYGVGNIIEMTVLADAEGYVAENGTVINGIPLISPRVEFTEISGGVYLLTYTVDVSDNSVLPGMLEAVVVLTDAAGNMGEPFGEIVPNSLEVYTELPTAILGGTPSICENEPAVLTAFIRKGIPPWSFDLTDGTDTITFADINVENYAFEVFPTEQTTYRIVTVSDVNGVQNTGVGSVTVEVQLATYVEFINLPTGFSIDDEPYQMEVNIPGGTFSGRGFINETGLFDPQIAGTELSPHTLYYTYINESECASMDSALVFVLSAAGDIFMEDTALCSNQDPVMVYGSNTAGVFGAFRLLDNTEQPVSGLTDLGDNTAEIEPGQLFDGAYIIEYEYTDGVQLYLRQEITVASVTSPNILGINDTVYCQSEPAVVLRSNIDQVLFEGPGVVGNITDGFVFEPDSAKIGRNTIVCTNFAGNGCSASSSMNLYVLVVPDIGFTVNSHCIAENGSLISFTNTTYDKPSVEKWLWSFDDFTSGADNFSDLASPEHFYADPGERTVVLSATTFDGCVASVLLDTFFVDDPVAGFSWNTNCYVEERETDFVNLTVGQITDLESFRWTIHDQDNTMLVEKETNSREDTLGYAFETMGTYTVSLEARNVEGCIDTATRVIALEPTIQLTAEGYQDEFNASGGGWTVRSDDQVESWTWGTPDFTGHTQPAADHSWYTSLPEEVSGYLEKSWMQSPCFDFNGMEKPIIQMDMMRSFVPNLDGAILQYEDNADEGWKTVGESTPGIEWYNLFNIYNQPGGSSLGWGLDVPGADQDWVSAVHGLDELVGSANVKFRIAIASSSRQSGIGNQGFAFDNIRIVERTKILVLEHFTNASDPDSKTADDEVDGLSNSQKDNLIDLQYHTSFPGVDPINENNPDPASTRSGKNGVYEVPLAVLDGSKDLDLRYDFTSSAEVPGTEEMDLLTLEIPKFSVDLEVDWFEDRVDLSTTVTCMTDLYDSNIDLYIAVLEKSVTAYTGLNGDELFRNVVLKMLPTPAGKLLGRGWYLGKSDTRSQSWTYESYVEDVDDLVVVAFVQDRTSNQILQAAVDHKNNLVGVGNAEREVNTLHLYPNPAKSSFFLNLGSRSQETGRIELHDMSGRTVISEQVPAGYQIYEVDIQHLSKGLYIVHWIEYGRVTGISKIVKTD